MFTFDWSTLQWLIAASSAALTVWYASSYSRRIRLSDWRPWYISEWGWPTGTLLLESGLQACPERVHTPSVSSSTQS